jgi:hypothetical protein
MQERLIVRRNMATKRYALQSLALVLSLTGLLVPAPAGAGGAQASTGTVFTGVRSGFKVPPLNFGASRFTIDVEPGPASGQVVSLGEVTVLDLTGRDVRLRFGLRSVHSPMFRDPGLRDVAVHATTVPLMTLDVDARIVHR